ncbi:dienelactone hydrolase family protein [Sphingomonas asaccharolytica]|uniref:dienelactone hydrolase family protein n=1 Tax=Sphingomonas asaccharolytica TaxID=40681 RepID=UPI000836D0D4|nr:dienelactone hydrolase family protein [Sphingomonas asaccharolytica]
MATIAIFHSVLGLRAIELATVARFQARGHSVFAPDLFEGRTAATVEEGFAIMEQVGWPLICDRARAALEQAPSTTVLLGFSMGAGVVSSIWPERRQASGIVLLHGLASVPANLDPRVPVQVHLADPDPFALPSQLHEWMRLAAASGMEMYRYPGLGHFFTDPSLNDFDADGAELVWDRVSRFLDTVDHGAKAQS